MSEDNMYAPITADNGKVIFKVGYSKDPKRRGGQLKQAARRSGITQEIHMRVSNEYMPASDISDHARLIEEYVIAQVAKRKSADPITKEFFLISVKDREYRYKHLTKWVKEARQMIEEIAQAAMQERAAYETIAISNPMKLYGAI